MEAREFGIQLSLVREALKHGCAAVLVAPPSFYKNITDIGVLAFYREIIQKIGDPNLRILLYHIPQLSGVPISLGIIEALRKEFPEIVIGIKESEGNLSFTKTILETSLILKSLLETKNKLLNPFIWEGRGQFVGLRICIPN